MAIPTTTTMTQTDSLVGAEVEEIEFTIGDPRWVMKTQADLYSNRELAVTREYSTNAFDANKQKALDEGVAIPPIEVTLPSVMNPYFKVRDYGYGMTRDILAEVYTKFGTSTKRDSNHYNGMLGYGSKSAVAYSTQFTVVSIANGIKTVAVVTRKPDWSIVMKIASQTKTTEPSGTEITVPVHNPDEFRQKAMDFYKFWMPGTVKVDGKTPEQAVGEKVSEGFYYSKNWNQSYVVMGNVPYRITNPEALFRDTRMEAFNFVAYVDNGDVEFTPSREDLKYTDLTKNTLRGIVKGFVADIMAKAQKDIDSAKTHAEAYAQWKKWTDDLGRHMFEDLTFKGDKFVSRFPINAYSYRYGVRDGSRNVNDWNVESVPNTLFVMESAMPTATNLKPTPTTLMKYNASQYREIKGLSTTRILFVRAASIDCKWFEAKGDNFVTYEEIVKVVPKKVRVSGGKTGGWKTLKGSHEVQTKDGTDYEVPLPAKPGKYWFYIDTLDVKKNDYSVAYIIANLPEKVRDKVHVVILPGNRKAKFHRENPTIKPFIAWAKTQIIKDGVSLLSKDAREAKSIGYQDEGRLKKLDARRVDDPELVRYIGLVKTRHAEAEYERNITLARALKEWSTVSTFEVKQNIEPFKGYPLYKNHMGVYGNFSEEWYLYLNAKYATTQKKGKK